MRFSSTLLPGVLAALSLSLAFGCGSDEGGPSRPEPATTLLGGGSAPTPQYIAITNTLNPKKAVMDHGGQLLASIEEDDLILFTSPQGLVPLQNDLRFELVQENTVYDASDVINMMVGFVETAIDLAEVIPGFDPFEDPNSVPNHLDCLELDAVHQVADGSGVRIAIIDTGVDLYHPDLAGHLELVNNPYLFDVYEDQPNGENDDSDEDNLVDEGFGHGTFMAGVMARIAPGATLIPLAAFNDDGAGSAFQIAVALTEASRSQADIVNLSFRLNSQDPVLLELLDRLAGEGITLIAAGGNTVGGAGTFPGTNSHTVGVAATVDCTGQIADFSAQDFSSLQLAAVGQQIVAPYPGLTQGQARYAFAHGTSTAAAVASGSFAVLLSSNTSYYSDPEHLAKRFWWTAAPVVPASAVMYGMMDLQAALGIAP